MKQSHITLELPIKKAPKPTKVEEKRGVTVIDILNDEEKDSTIILNLLEE